MNRVLTEVHELFKDKSKWTQGAYARTKNGNPVGPFESTATCWCLDGALALKAGDFGTPEYWVARQRTSRIKRLDFGGIHSINDIEGYDAVMALLERAISNG